MGKEDDKKLTITPIDEARDVSKALASDTARTILKALAEEPLSTVMIASKLNLPVSTVDYHVKRLSNAGLMVVHHKRWSPKGRKVNYYVPVEKFIVLTPQKKQAGALQALRKIAPLLGLSGIMSFFVEHFTAPKPVVREVTQTVTKVIAVETPEATAAEVLDVLRNAIATPPSLPLEAAKGHIISTAQTITTGNVTQETAANATNIAELAKNISESLSSNLTNNTTIEVVKKMQVVTYPDNPHYGIWLFVISLIFIFSYFLFAAYFAKKNIVKR